MTAPGFALLLHVLFDLFGFGHVLAQSPAFVAGCLGIAGVVLLAASLTGSRMHGLLAGLILAVSPIHSAMSVRVKHFTLDALLACGLIALTHWVVTVRPTSRRLGVLCGTVMLSTMASTGTAFVGAACVAAAVFAARRGGVRWVPAVIGLLLGWVAWLVLYLRHAIADVLVHVWADRYPDTASVGAWLASTWQGLLRTAEGIAPVPPLFTVFLVAVGVIAALRRSQHVLVIISMGPVLAVVVAATLGLVPLGGGRTDTVLYPGLVVAMVAAVPAVARPWRTVSFVGLGALMLVAGLVRGAVEYQVEDVRSLLDVLRSDREFDDALIMHNFSQFAYGLYGTDLSDVEPASSINGIRVVPTTPNTVILPVSNETPELYRDFVPSLTPHCDTVWALLSHFKDAEYRNLARGLSSTGLVLEEEWRRTGAVLQRWERVGVSNSAPSGPPCRESSAGRT